MLLLIVRWGQKWSSAKSVERCAQSHSLSHSYQRPGFAGVRKANSDRVYLWSFFPQALTQREQRWCSMNAGSVDEIFWATLMPGMVGDASQKSKSAIEKRILSKKIDMFKWFSIVGLDNILVKFDLDRIRSRRLWQNLQRIGTFPGFHRFLPAEKPEQSSPSPPRAATIRARPPMVLITIPDLDKTVNSQAMTLRKFYTAGEMNSSLFSPAMSCRPISDIILGIWM